MSQEIEEQGANVIVFLKIPGEDSIYGAFEMDSNDLKTRWI